MLATKSEVGQPYGVAGDATQFIYSDHEFPNIASAIKFAKRQGLLSKNDRPRLTAIGEDRKYIPVTKASDVENPEYTQFIASDPGSIYTVDIPDEKIAQMLDWDKPLSQQPKAVKEAVNSIVLAEELYKGKYAPRFLDTKTTGGEAIEIFNSVLGSPQVTSNYLREAGIPGIQYLDQASRGAKQGTRNFVVFPGEEGALKILDVYAKGGAVHMQDGGSPLDRFTGRAPKRGASSLPGYGEGIDDPTTQALLAIRRNLGEAGRAVVGAKPYDETNPTETYRAMQALFNAPTPAAIIPEAAQAAGKAAGALSGLGALGAISPRVTKIVEPTIDIAEIIQSPVQQTVKTAPKSIAEMTAEIIGKGELNVREPGSLSGQIPSSSASNNIQPITTVQLPTGQFATTTGFSTVKPIRTGFDVAETPEQVAHLTAGLRKSPQEQVVAVVVDKNNKPIQVIRHTVGLVNQSSAEPFSLVGAIANTPGAKGFYISHNHPSGVSQLSNSDERLADALLNITKDTDIQMRGMLAIGKDKFAFYDPVNKTSFRDKQIPPALRDKSIDMVERTLKKTQVLNKSAFSLPSDATAFADNFVGDQTGVVLLNNQHYPVGFMPIDATQFANLRKSGTAINILRGLERANANKAVLITKNNITPKELENIEGFFNASSVKLLDALTGPQRKSESATGRLGYNRSESFQSAIPIGVGLGAAAIQEKEYKKGGAVKPRTSDFEGMNFYDILFSR